MTTLNPEDRRALQYWGVIESVTLAGGSTQDLWQAINAQAEALGYERSGISIQNVNRLRSQAVALRQAGNRLEQLGPDDLLGGLQIGQAPWARPLGQQVSTPMWSVRFEHLIERDGVQLSEYRTSTFTGTVPRSRRELEEALDEDGANLANDYGATHLGIGEYRVLAV